MCDDVSNRSTFAPMYAASACILVDLRAEIQTDLCDIISFPELALLLDAFAA